MPNGKKSVPRCPGRKSINSRPWEKTWNRSRLTRQNGKRNIPKQGIKVSRFIVSGIKGFECSLFRRFFYTFICFQKMGRLIEKKKRWYYN
jgi:hypothetical protein